MLQSQEMAGSDLKEFPNPFCYPKAESIISKTLIARVILFLTSSGKDFVISLSNLLNY